MVSETSNVTKKVVDYDLAATLNSGQAFCWELVGPNEWRGWVGATPVTVVRGSDCLRVTGRNLDTAALARYFQWDADLAAIVKTFPNDPAMRKAMAYCRGLRILRQDPWETLANFICSSMKRVSQIQQIHRSLRESFGVEVEPGRRNFPSWKVLAEVSEEQLRKCKLGFRAVHLARAARQLAAREISLEAIESMPTAEAREELMRIRGVGEKVANCILLFAYGRLEVVPVDVWIKRAIHTLYFPKARQLSEKKMRDFVASYFGPHAGYAQQYLFHWMRTGGDRNGS